MNDTFDIIAPILLIVAIYREWINRKRIKRLKLNQSANEGLLDDYQSRIKFWRTRCEEFNLDKQILHERNLRIRFEKLYHKSLAELDKLKDGRKNNGTKHKQRTSKGNPIKQPLTKVKLDDSWIPVHTLPNKSMVCRWVCADGVEDIGFYYSDKKSFASTDLNSSKPITHWKPAETIIKTES